MKKLSLILATLMMLSVFVSSFSIPFGAAGVMDSFTEVDPIAEEDKIISTTNTYFLGINEITDPVGQWNWAEVYNGKDGCWPINNQVNPIDCNLKTICWGNNPEDYKGATHVSQMIMASTFTQSGLGNEGRIKPEKVKEDFEQLTLIYSPDAINWSSVGFTVGYHTEASNFTDAQGDVHPVDTYWHLIFDEPIAVADFAWIGFHSAEERAWDADDYSYSLCIVLQSHYTYLVKGSGDVPPAGDVTDAPATDAPATDAPATDAPATDAPATDAPATDAPATDAPATDAPATDAPVTDAPATDAPAADAENNMTWVYVAIAAAVVVVVVVVVVVAKKKK